MYMFTPYVHVCEHVNMCIYILCILLRVYVCISTCHATMCAYMCVCVSIYMLYHCAYAHAMIL